MQTERRPPRRSLAIAWTGLTAVASDQFHQAVIAAGGAMLSAIEDARREFEDGGNVSPQRRLEYDEVVRNVEIAYVQRIVDAAGKYGEANIAASYRDRLR